MGQRRVLAAAGAAALLAITMVPSPLQAQAAPTLAVSPTRLDPGETYTITVTDCADVPEVFIGISDTLTPVVLTATGTAGEWTATQTASASDAGVLGSCGDQELAPVSVDVDAPKMAFHRPDSFPPPPATPTTVYGTDCPDGTTVTASFTPGSGDAVVIEEIAIDGHGDWQVDVPAFPAGTTVLVGASCGDVSYEALTYTTPGGPTTTVPVTTTTVVPPVAPPPASARPGQPTYTG